MTRDGRFRWAATIVFALLLTALAMGWQNYRDVAAQRDAAQAATREQWVNQGEKNQHSAAHYGIYAFKPVMPLSFADRGLDAYTGVTVWLEAHKQNLAQYRPAQDGTQIQRFGELTAATILQVLLPLLIVLLTFSAFAGEREQGVLRQIISLGVKTKDMVCGKALGVFTALALLLVPATVIGIAALMLATSGSSAPQSFLRGALMGVSYLLYFVALVGISLAISARVQSSRLALVILLGFWIMNSLVAPRALSDLGKRIYPAPSLEEFQAAVNRDIAQGIDGHNPADKRAEELKRKTLAQYGVQKLEDLPVNFSGISLQAGEEHSNVIFDKHYPNLWNIYERQNRVQKMGAVVAPMLAIRPLSMSLSGTDFEQFRHFATSAEQYRRLLVKEMNDNLAYTSKTGQRDIKAGKELWESVPAFEYTPPGIGWVLREQATSLGLLILWAAGASLFALVSVQRMKIN
jgi:ABC-2 type transport system permease protein